MDTTSDTAATDVIFARTRVDARDQAVFIAKLGAVAGIGIVGVALAVSRHPLVAALGVFVLGALYTHMVELQHQCLHHSAFVRADRHRPIGVLLGLPMLVSFSHYRVRHLQHHRYLGTDRDTEFFGFDTRQPLTTKALLRGLFDYKRPVLVMVDSWRSWRGTWRYDDGQIAERFRGAAMAEYRLIGLFVVGLAVAAAAGLERFVMVLWALPVLLVSVPLHFAVELPEHLLCDNDSTDVLRNTRSITGSRFSTWYTNSNNLHVEHHAAMTVPLQRLPERHDEVRQVAKYVDHSYWSFYRSVLRELVTRR